MAASNFLKAALNNARSHKPWERAGDDSRDVIEAVPLTFEDAAAPMAPAFGSQLSAAAPDVQRASGTHEITHAQVSHTSPPPAAGHGNAGGEQASAEQHVGAAAGTIPLAPQAGAAGGPAIAAPQAAPGGPTESIDEDNLEDLLEKLNRDGVQWEPGTELLVGFPQSYDEIPELFHDLDAFGAGEHEFFSATQQDHVMQALQTWADVADVSFRLAEPDETPDLYFYAQLFNDSVNAGAYSSGIDATNGSRIVFNTAAGSWPDLAPGTGGFALLIHEAGHSLGLSHPGAYDADDAEAPTYEDSAEYIQDTKMYSVMSYFGPVYTGFSGDGDGLVERLVTPRSHDMYVMHELYGADWDARSGNTTYGYNAFGVSDLYDFTNFGGAGEEETPQLTIWDGGGVDWLDLSGDGSNVTLDLRPGAFSSTHGMTYNLSLAYVPDNAPDEFAGYIENARGGDGDDSITGNSRANVLEGNDGNDELDGGDGNDELDGGDGDDLLDGGDGEDRLLGGADRDELFGRADDDWLEGEGGDDVLKGGGGDDFLLGGSGIDIASYDGESAGVRVDLNIVGFQDTVGSGIDLLQDIEGLTGSSHSDWLFGSNGANQLSGGSGEDQMFGRNGNDTLLGGDGNDNLFGGLGNDVLNGGNGTDWANYSLEAAAVSVNLTTQNQQNTLGAGLDTLIGIENVIGTGFNDLLIGNSSANRLEGGTGNDVLTGNAGSDVLFGGAGNDNLNGGTGNDVLEGGTGIDWALYHTGLASGVTIDLFAGSQNTGGGGIDTLHDIENVWGTLFADSLNGNNVANELRGEGGNDWLWGNGGNDVVNGGSGDDAVAGGSGADDVTGGSGNDHLWGGSSSDDFMFDDGWGDDWIWDFQPGSDRIDLSDVAGLTSLNQIDVENTADGALYTFNGQSILLVGVSALSVQTTDFIL